ncbi:PREDICTED: ectonucleoside triphosphate diphosphohydrolase 8-like [Pseudopodoces humilis]|uniref:ectonucleoside triphosphate diphosphohydrolase 8-like n=1 Tax=Pseudopodoces humilis TaxID=181119 RepID=UPI0006B72B3B|nr:PREDICTED: ectonucleoside triphosphate diphosphohydrolase 8-like [Pseudopodoces humilis]
MKIVPAEQQRETPTYLGATAGMRLLREENGTKAQQVLAEVSKAIGEYPVHFRGARILTGSEEGSFGWITVNYLLETLLKVQLGTGECGERPCASSSSFPDVHRREERSSGTPLTRAKGPCARGLQILPH